MSIANLKELDDGDRWITLKGYTVMFHNKTIRKLLDIFHSIKAHQQMIL